MSIKDMFAAEGRKTKGVTIKVGDVEHEVYVGKITAEQMDRVLKFIKDGDSTGMNCYLVQVGLYETEDGERAFNDTEADRKIVRGVPVQFVKAIADEVFEFNRLTNLDDAVKNS